MEIYNDKLCLTYEEVFAVIGSNFCNLLGKQVKNLLGRACYCHKGLYDVEDFPNNKKNRYRDMLYENYPDLQLEKTLRESREVGEIQSTIFAYMQPDGEARKFFLKQENMNDGERLRYENSAMVLNAMRKVYERSYSRHSAAGKVSKMRIGDFYKNMSAAMPGVVEKFELSFKRFNWRRLGEIYNDYCKYGYESLVHGGKGNDNARIVDATLENLIISKYCESNKPYAKWVAEDVSDWMKGDILAANKDTGEVFDKKYKRNKISAGTVLNYLNNPSNRAMLEQKRMSYHKYGAEIRPNTLRKAPVYSLSKISLDDRDIPRKEKSGKRVKAYYAYDVATGAIIGAAYSMKKDENLFIECLRDMFRTLEKWNVGIPMEIEVENHLTRKFEGDLLKAGEIFPFVRWCAPTNSQEKGAEQWNRSKKYVAEKRGGQQEIGRWYSKNNTNNAALGERVYNEETDRYEIKQKTYTFDELVADDRVANEAHNMIIWTEQAAKKHERNIKFIGKTRHEALIENVNPSATAINRENTAKYIGIQVTPGNQQKGLKLYRNQYVNALYGQYMLPSVEVLSRLEPNNYELECYYFEDNEKQLYMYQDGRYICTARRVEKFTTSKAEWTDADTAAMTEQMKYITHFDSTMREGRKARIADLLWEKKEKVDAIIAGVAGQARNDVEVYSPPPEPPEYEYVDYTEVDYEYEKMAAIDGI